MTQTRDADDHAALLALARMPEVRSRLAGRARVRLLWEVCQVPDFRKTLTGDHSEFLARIFVHLCDGGRIPTDFVGRRIERLDRVDGEIDTLMARIAYIRTWSYLAFRSDWLDDAGSWQERTRAVEDRLSDALHQALTERFVDRRAVVLGERLERDGPLVASVLDGKVVAAGQILGRLDGLRFAPDVSGSRAGDRAVGRAVSAVLRPLIAERVARVLAEPDDAFRLGEDAWLHWEDAPLASLRRGRDIRSPAVALQRTEHVGAAERSQVERRLTAWLRGRVDALLGLGDLPSGAGAAARGLAYSLELGLGSVPRRDVRKLVEALDPADHRVLAARGVRLGTETVYVGSTLCPAAVAMRRALWMAWEQPPRVPPPLRGDPVEEVGPAPLAYLRAVGYRSCGALAVRVDALERFASWARREIRARGRIVADDGAGRALGSSVGTDPILRALGYREVGQGAWAPSRGRRGR